MRIGMIDSGVGGLTVLKEFLKYLPNNEYIYFGDTKRVPYGDKSKETILEFSQEMVEFLVTKNIDVLIVACNSISATVCDELNEIYDFKVIGVIQPTTDYVKEKEYDKIGVIGTKATINSGIYQTKLSNIKVFGQACPLFVPIIEENIQDEIILDRIIKLYLKNIKELNLDALILGCTHYPIIKNRIQEYLPEVDIINPAKETALYFANHLGNYATQENQIIEIYFSDVNKNVIELSERILGFTNLTIRKYDLTSKK